MSIKATNLLSVVQSTSNLSDNLTSRYLNHFGVVIRKSESLDLDRFIQLLRKASQNIKTLDNYYIGYTIPQISKEFDLLRLGENYIINIELKRESTIDKIKEQLVRNKYYLSFLNVNVLNYAFTADKGRLYKLDNSNDLIEENFIELAKVLINQVLMKTQNIDELFNPSNYLVSPFNSTLEFINGNYFLTGQQEEIKRNTLEIISKNKPAFIKISGAAGTGKSLLVYDIVKEFYKTDKVLIIHCGFLNDGHYKLRDEYSWDIIPIKNLTLKNLSKYSLVMIDEVQRIYPGQLEYIIQNITTSKASCIFALDNQQCLKKEEITNKIGDRIDDKTNPVKFHLTEKIRTNKEIASFIKCVFDRALTVEKFNRSNIELVYFKEYSAAKEYLSLLSSNEWKVINYTPSRKHVLPYDNYALDNEDNAHTVIGQEFDKVVAVIDSHFFYKNNKLSTKNYSNRPFYHPTKMLFQIMSRTRRKLCFIVVDNPEIMERCLSILE